MVKGRVSRQPIDLKGYSDSLILTEILCNLYYGLFCLVVTVYTWGHMAEGQLPSETYAINTDMSQI